MRLALLRAHLAAMLLPLGCGARTALLPADANSDADSDADSDVDLDSDVDVDTDSDGGEPSDLDRLRPRQVCGLGALSPTREPEPLVLRVMTLDCPSDGECAVHRIEGGYDLRPSLFASAACDQMEPVWIDCAMPASDGPTLELRAWGEPLGTFCSGSSNFECVPTPDCVQLPDDPVPEECDPPRVLGPHRVCFPEEVEAHWDGVVQVTEEGFSEADEVGVPAGCWTLEDSEGVLHVEPRFARCADCERSPCPSPTASCHLYDLAPGEYDVEAGRLGSYGGPKREVEVVVGAKPSEQTCVGLEL